MPASNETGTPPTERQAEGLSPFLPDPIVFAAAGSSFLPVYSLTTGKKARLPQHLMATTADGRL